MVTGMLMSQKYLSMYIEYKEAVDLGVNFVMSTGTTHFVYVGTVYDLKNKDAQDLLKGKLL